MSLVIFAGIVANLPSVIANTYTQYTSQEMDLFRIVLMSTICILIVAGVVFMEQGARQIPVQYAKRQVGRKIFGGQSSHLPIRVNTAGVIPAIFASQMLQIPLTIGAFSPNSRIAEFINAIFIPGGWLYNLTYAAMIMFFAFFYTSLVFKADDIAENLKKHGGFIPGIRPGARTAEFLQKVLTRLTLVGSLYLASICILPTILTGKFNVQFYFGGTSLLIVVGVALETFRQIEAHRQSLRYDSYLKRGKIRPRRGAGV
jgi:preprotein translocase subunit SecY